MSREKAYFRETVADLLERSGGKMLFNCRTVMAVLKIGHGKAIDMMDGKKQISVYDLARKIID